jgi:ABC-type nitrate/sulfonate/bicarbonate transport system substrate-binding protein
VARGAAAVVEGQDLATGPENPSVPSSVTSNGRLVGIRQLMQNPHHFLNSSHPSILTRYVIVTPAVYIRTTAPERKAKEDMRNIDWISFPYRSSSHLTFLHVVGESGSWSKYGLDVDYDRQITKDTAHSQVASSEVEFVSGNHISTYGKRVRGDKWVYLGQTLNSVNPKLVVRQDSGINGIADLRGKRIGTRGHHPGLNDWLLLKKRGVDADRGDVEFVKKVDGLESSEAAEQLGPTVPKAKRTPVWQWIRDGKVDAALLMPPSHLFAADAGLKVIDIEPMPMIWFTTISSSLPFVEKHPDIVERFLKGLIEGIHFFKTERERSIDIIQRRYTKEGQLNRGQATYMWQTLAPQLSPKLYPSMKAIENVYEEALREDADAGKINPMELWDTHHIRRIDDSGFIAKLYEDTKADPDAKHARDPDFQKDERKKQEATLAAVKACGHPLDMACGCD